MSSKEKSKLISVSESVQPLPVALPVANEIEGVQTVYSALREGDEIDAFYGSTARRCKITSQPVVKGDRVSFHVLPVSSRTSYEQQNCIFSASYPVVAYRRIKSTDSRIRYQDLVLEHLPSDDFLNLEELAALLHRKLGELIDSVTLRQVCSQLAYAKKISAQKSETVMVSFRKPLPGQRPEIVTTKSIAYRESKIDQCKQAILENLPATKAVMSAYDIYNALISRGVYVSRAHIKMACDELVSDCKLIPVNRGEKRISYRHPIGHRDYQEVFLPEYLLRDAYQPDGRLKYDRVLQLGKLLGLVAENAQRMTQTQWNCILTTLNRRYPEWKNHQANKLNLLNEN